MKKDISVQFDIDDVYEEALLFIREDIAKSLLSRGYGVSTLDIKVRIKTGEKKWDTQKDITAYAQRRASSFGLR